MAIQRLIDRTSSQVAPDQLYQSLAFPDPPTNRPYTFVNMVSTVDGKVLVGPVGSTAKGLGGQTDQMLMHRLRDNADAAIIGAGTLRAGRVRYSPEMVRAVVTGGGGLPLDNPFFTEATSPAIVFAPASLPEDERQRLDVAATVRIVGTDRVDLREAVQALRQEFEVGQLVLEGGPGLNYEFFSAGLVDELFLTVAPKLKGGSQVPTIVEGPGMPDWEWLALSLLSVYHDGDEVYMRYRVGGRGRV